MRLTSHKTKRDSKLELQMTSMIDIVFLLLIFFMTTATFRKTEKELNPAIQVKESSDSTKSDFEPTIIDVTERGGRFVYLIGENEVTDESELTDLLRQFDNKVDGAFVRVSDEPPFDMAARAIQACKAAGYYGVTYVPNPN